MVGKIWTHHPWLPDWLVRTTLSNKAGLARLSSRASARVPVAPQAKSPQAHAQNLVRIFNYSEAQSEPSSEPLSEPPCLCATADRAGRDEHNAIRSGAAALPRRPGAGQPHDRKSPASATRNSGWVGGE